MVLGAVTFNENYYELRDKFKVEKQLTGKIASEYHPQTG